MDTRTQIEWGVKKYNYQLRLLRVQSGKMPKIYDEVTA
jgi:hypothetical protein